MIKKCQRPKKISFSKIEKSTSNKFDQQIQIYQSFINISIQNSKINPPKSKEVMSISSEIDLFLLKAKKILRARGFRINESKMFNGSFGYVLLVQDQEGFDFAVKIISLNHYSYTSQVDKKLLENAQYETKIMKENQHENILILIDSFFEGTIYFIIMEQAQMTLEDYLQQINQSNQAISEDQFFSFAGQMVNGMAFLHKRNILLRDFKPSNILMFQNDRIKLSDFGMCKKFVSQFDIDQYKQSTIKGSYFFYPPEIMEKLNDIKSTQQYLENNPIQQTFKGDVWALGISLLTLLEVKPFTSIGLSLGYTSFQNVPHFSEKINNFLKLLLERDPEKRPSILVVKGFLKQISKQYSSFCLIEEGIILRDKEQNYDLASEFFKQSIEEDPQNSMSYFNLALTQNRQKIDSLKEKSKSNLRKALALNPLNPYILGLQSQFEDNLQKKYQLIKTALSLNRFNSYVLVQFGFYHEKQKNYEESEKFYMLAIKYNVENGRAYYFLGFLYKVKNQIEKALETFRLGIGRDYSDSLFFTEIGRIYCNEKNQEEEGMNYLRMAVRSNQMCTVSKYILGQQYIKYKKLEQALEIFQQLIKILPRQDYYNELHEALFSLQNYDECENQALQALQKNKNFWSYFNLAQVSARLNKKQQLIESYEQVLLIEPENGNNYSDYGLFLEEVGEKKMALNKYIKSSQLGNDCKSEIDRLKKDLGIKN